MSLRFAALAVAGLLLVATPAFAASDPTTTPNYTLKCHRNTGRVWLGAKWASDNKCPAWLVMVDSAGTYYNVDPGARFGPRLSAPDLKGNTVTRVQLHKGSAICNPSKPCWEVGAGSGGKFKPAHNWTPVYGF